MCLCVCVCVCKQSLRDKTVTSRDVGDIGLLDVLIGEDYKLRP